MLDKPMLYDIIYALIALGGREQALFGSYAPLAHEAFERSLAGSDFPELWFELPLLGEPWFDLHVLTSRAALDGGELFAGDAAPHYPHLFEWFAAQPAGVRQLALSYDLHEGRLEHPAAQLLVNTYDPGVMCGFLEEAGGPDKARAFRSFVERLPRGWFACYAGVFPERPEVGLRVECIPDVELQRAYAQDAALLERHLRQTGLAELGDTLVPRCQQLADTPYRIEFQFDVAPDGAASEKVGASLRFACPPGEGGWEPLGASGAGERLMQLVESWGLADERWRLLPEAAFAKNVAHAGQSECYYSFPAFVKMRWQQGEPLDAKAYIIAGKALE